MDVRDCIAAPGLAASPESMMSGNFTRGALCLREIWGVGLFGF